MTAHGVDSGLFGSLRLGERGAVVSPLEGVEGASAGVDSSAGSNRTLSPDSLTYHIQPAVNGFDPTIQSPERDGRGADRVSRHACSKCHTPFDQGQVRFRVTLVNPKGAGMVSQHGRSVALLCTPCVREALLAGGEA